MKYLLLLLLVGCSNTTVEHDVIKYETPESGSPETSVVEPAPEPSASPEASVSIEAGDEPDAADEPEASTDSGHDAGVDVVEASTPEPTPEPVPEAAPCCTSSGQPGICTGYNIEWYCNWDDPACGSAKPNPSCQFAGGSSISWWCCPTTNPG